MQKFLRLSGCHATIIRSSFIYFQVLYIFQINMASQNSDMNNAFRIIFIIVSIIKVHLIKIYTKNTYLITTKCGITRIFIKRSILSSSYKAVRSFLIILLVTNQSGTYFNAGRKSSMALLPFS